MKDYYIMVWSISESKVINVIPCRNKKIKSVEKSDDGINRNLGDDYYTEIVQSTEDS